MPTSKSGGIPPTDPIDFARLAAHYGKTASPSYLDPTLLSELVEGYREKSIEERDQLATRALAGRFDLLNKAINEAEAKLKGIKPVRDVWIAYDIESRFPDGTGPCTWDLLGFAKMQGKWRLAHAYDYDGNEEGFVERQVLVECPIAIRVRAVKELRRLSTEIVADKEKFIPEVDAAIKELTDFCAGK